MGLVSGSSLRARAVTRRVLPFPPKTTPMPNVSYVVDLQAWRYVDQLIEGRKMKGGAYGLQCGERVIRTYGGTVKDVEGVLFIRKLELHL